MQPKKVRLQGGARTSGGTRWALAFLAVCCVLPASVRAQATYSENFDSLSSTISNSTGPQALTSRGWIFRNQSQGPGANGYYLVFPGVNAIFPSPHTSANQLGVNDAAAGQVGDALNAWAVLPAIPNQRAGDLIIFHANTHTTDSRLELRYSPSGGSGTGSGAAAVGDFTQLLGTVAPTADAWVRQQFTAPGTGRLAFRYTGTRAAWNGFADFLGIDTLSVGAAPTPSCNLPPVPSEGQTVHWTAAQSPYRLCQGLTIPAGSTVIIDPGVRLDADAGMQITLRGTIQSQGTAAAPITLAAAAIFPPMLLLDGGTLQTAFTDFRGQLRPMANGTLDLADTTFTGPNGAMYTDLYSGAGFARLERVTFNNSEFTLSNYTLVLNQVTANNSTVRLIRDYPFLGPLTADGKTVDIDATPQGTLIDGLTVRNVTTPPGGQTVNTGYGLGLNEGNFFIGPSISLSNNTFPVRIVSAGILPGSVLPVTGNLQNLLYIPGRDHHADVIWADAGVPYYIADFYSQHGGSLRILDGARVMIASGAGIAADPSLITVYGTEERPTFFEQAVAGQPWLPLQNFHRIRHAVLDGAMRGAAWPAQLGWGSIDSSIVRNCTEFGVTGQAIVRKTLFQNNTVGANVSFNQLDLDGSTNPNAFEGNTVGVSAAGNAVENWWNSPTGPISPDNPGGTGDPKAGDVPFLPFRTERPDFTDAPPIVDLENHSFMARPGDKFILTWKARDDGSILSQRVIMSVDGDVVQGNLIEPVITLADNLPGTQRSLEFVVPTPQSRFFGKSNIRIEATDNAGQVGWDDLHMYLENSEQGELVLISPQPTTVTAGQNLGQVCWQPENISNLGGSVNAYLLLENSDYFISLGGVTTYLDCLSLQLSAPWASTDRARVVLSLYTGGGVNQPEYYFGPAFSIRPDARVGDVPPTVNLTAPAAGASAPGGSVLAIRWTASDDQFVRAFNLQVSTDGGRTWSSFAHDLPGTSTGYDWTLPPSTGIADVRFKVIAVDRNFQDTSSIVQVGILPGDGAPPCRADVNGSGSVSVQDVFDFLSAYFSGTAAGDFNQSGAVSVQDIFDYLTAYFVGCP